MQKIDVGFKLDALRQGAEFVHSEYSWKHSEWSSKMVYNEDGSVKFQATAPAIPTTEDVVKAAEVFYKFLSAGITVPPGPPVTK